MYPPLVAVARVAAVVQGLLHVGLNRMLTPVTQARARRGLRAAERSRTLHNDVLY